MRRGPPPGHSRVELWIPDHQLLEIRDAAREAGISVGAWLRCAALAALDNDDLDTDEEAVEADRAARPSQGITDGPKMNMPLPNGRGGFVLRAPPAVTDDEAIAMLRAEHPDGRIALRRGSWGVLAWSEAAA